jgi:hypothetical protein
MGVNIGGLKKWFDGAANDAQGVYHQVNPFDGGRTFSTNSRGVMPVAPVQQPGQAPHRNFFEKSFDQVNPFDAGRTYQQGLPQQDNSSVIHQMSHNGLTNTVGNLLVKPFVINPAQIIAETGRGIAADVTENPAAQQAAAHRQWQNLKASIPGFIGQQVWHAGGTIRELPRAIQGDVMGGSLAPQTGNGAVDQTGFALTNPIGFAMAKFGHHAHAPTQEQQQAYNKGMQNLNQTVVGQMVSPVEAVYGDHGGADAKAQLQAGGYNTERTGAAKYFADPVMGAFGTYGLAKGAMEAPKMFSKPGSVKVTDTPGAGIRPADALQTQLEGAWNKNDMAGAQKVIDQMPPDLKTSMQALQDSKAGQSTTHPVVDKSTGKITIVNDAAPKTATIAGGKPVEPVQTGFPSNTGNRSFVQTMIDSELTKPKLRSKLQDLDTTYRTRNTDALQQKAANFVKSNPDEAMQIAKGGKDDISIALGHELIHKLQNDGHIDLALDLAKNLSEKGTELGRGVQAFSAYSRIAPEGILRFAQNEIAKYNELVGRTVEGKKNILGQDRSPVKLTSEAAQKLVDMSNEAQKFPEGSAERGVATAKLIAEVQRQMPATLAEKLGTAQTMAQLLNVKTNVRNIMGNGMFGAMDNLSQVVGTGVDAVVSKLMGTDRTTTLPNLKVQGKNFIEGGKTGIREAKEGINTGPSSQFDLNSVPVFRGKILGTLEKTMNGTLRGADRAAYEAAFTDTIHGLQKLAKTDKVTPEMLEQAHHTALYRTFQDSNAVSDFFVGMKKSLNKVGIGVEGKRFGLGDIVLKYPKTPGNLLARGIDYSPAGFIKSVFEASKPLFGKEFNQKAFVDSFSRAAVGSTAAFGIGYAMSDAGIITAQPDQNKDLRNVQKTAGLGGYQINADGFKRWVASGFNKDAAKLQPGDHLVSYDWAQPMAIPISAGAALGAHKPVKDGAASTASNFANSANTLVEQPLLQGVQRLFGGYGGLGDAAVNTAVSGPASFVPTAISQLNQLFDNHSRITTDQNPFQEATNLVKSKIPGAAQSLPVGYDVQGNAEERYQDGGNNAFNVLANPAFISQYKPTNATQEVLGLYNRTGETKQTPNTVPTSVKITGPDGKPQTVKLTGQQQSDYQKYTGQMTTQMINQLANDPNYRSLPDTEKVKILSANQTDINNAAKVKILGNNPADITSDTAAILAADGGTNSGTIKLAAASANEKVAVEKFKNSSDKTKLIGSTYYFKTKDGTVSSMPKVEYDFNIANSKLSLDMDRAQAGDDINTWMGLAEKQYNALESKKQLYDPGTESDKIDAITLQQENLMQKVQKYQEYGGFKKGSGGAGRSLPRIDVGIPSNLTGQVVSNSSYSAPKVALKNKGTPGVRVRKSTVKITTPKKLA